MNTQEKLLKTMFPHSTISYDVDKDGNVTNLSLRGNRFRKLPQEIGLLTNLLRLDLSENQLCEIPKEIEQLTKLKWLDLSDNNLRELPSEIGQLKQIEGGCYLAKVERHKRI